MLRDSCDGFWYWVQDAHEYTLERNAAAEGKQLEKRPSFIKTFISR